MNANIRSNITAWGDISKQTTVWDYVSLLSASASAMPVIILSTSWHQLQTTNFLMIPCPFPDWYAQALDIKFLHKEGKMRGAHRVGSANLALFLLNRSLK